MNEILTIRKKVLVEELMQHNMSYALITNPSNIFYFTGIAITPHERFLGLLVDSKQDTYQMIVPELESNKVRDYQLDQMVYRDNEDALEILTEQIRDCSYLGVEKNHISLNTAQTLENYLKSRHQNFTGYKEIGEFINKMRLIKDLGEIQRLRKAAICIDEVLKNTVNYIAIGRTEKQVKAKILQEIAEQKGTSGVAFDIQVSSGPNASNPHGETGDRRVREGEAIVIDCGVVYGGYRSDITRTFFAGTPAEDIKKIYSVVLEAQKKAIDTVKPGLEMRQIDIAARNVIEKAGYGRYFTCRVGHGIGIDIHELPSLHDRNKGLLKEGMVFTIEPGIYIPGVVGVRIEDDVVVTEDGVEILTQFPKELNEIIIF